MEMTAVWCDQHVGYLEERLVIGISLYHSLTHVPLGVSKCHHLPLQVPPLLRHTSILLQTLAEV